MDLDDIWRDVRRYVRTGVGRMPQERKSPEKPTHAARRSPVAAISLLPSSPSASKGFPFSQSCKLVCFSPPPERRSISCVCIPKMAPATTALQEMSNDGAFRRTASTFRNFISRDPSAEFPAAAGRYHLYISYACPWASRCYAFLKLKGLEDAIGVTVTKPKWERTREGEEHFGWVFPSSEDEEPGAQPDPINGAKSIRELYELAVPGYSGKCSVPVLWDKVKRTIVNNESSDIVQMFNSEFVEFAKHSNCDLIPAHLKGKIDEVNSFIYDSINNGVYRCGFAKQQKPYDEAVEELFNALDKCEEILSTQRYLCGHVLTESDIRLFATLIRFDEVYVVHFKCNRRNLREYHNLFNYTKDIYQSTGIADTVNMYHIKKHYYCSHPSINPFGIIPVGPGLDYTTPHDRDKFRSH
ncbi:hypothetical protein GOP47_0018646 [Adiantum capillus-veneris]|uniref:GST C-terminal domain-containing protein n=1 Tax=Adiantum capillus-veneris TaxID=13818 RepID=A0A9D4Z9U5_ADICA|nr:hypothetical protein GOP47_0018646 [Adiantum capillus-veneris]